MLLLHQKMVFVRKIINFCVFYWFSKVYVWNWKYGSLVHSLYGHKKLVTSVRIHPTLPIIASASDDNTVKLWISRSFLKKVVWINRRIQLCFLWHLRNESYSECWISFSVDSDCNIMMNDFDFSLSLSLSELEDLLTSRGEWDLMSDTKTDSNTMAQLERY